MESNCKAETPKNEHNTETQNTRRRSLSHQYSKDELLDLCSSPAASVRPSCLSQDFDGPDGKWDPERWHLHLSGRRSRGSSPTLMLERRPSDLERELFRRRPSDARERIKEERDGIVLSPQRRSFGHGCQVSAQSAFTRRSGSPLDQKEGDGTNSNQAQRRIGSGRLTNRTRSLDYDERATTRQVRERYDREFDHEKDGRFDRYGPKDTRRLTRSEARRHYNKDMREPEPEWFSAGPSSQSETIELHGFQTEDLRKDDDREPNCTPKVISVKNRNGSYETHHSSSPETSHDHDTSSAAAEDQNFDINQFFSFNDTIPGLPEMVDSPDVGEASQTSRFSQWFSSVGNRSHSSSHSGGSRRSTPHEELESLHDFSNRSNPVPSPTPEAPVFQPIAPPDGQEAFLHMLQKANINPYANAGHSEDSVQFKDQVIAGKAKSVAELEAELKELVIGNNNKNKKPVQPVVVTHIQHPTPPPTLQKTEKQPENGELSPEMSAFDKLVFSMKATGNLPTVTKTVLKSDGRPLSPLDLSRQDENLRLKHNGPEPAVLVRPPSGPTPPSQDTVVTLQRPEPKMPQQKLSPPPLHIPMPQMGRLTPTFAQQNELLQELVKNNQMTAGRPQSPNFLAVNQLKPTPQQQQQMLKNMAQRSISPSQELLGVLLKQQQQAAGVQRPQSPQEFLQQVLMQPQSTPRGPSPSPLSIPVSVGRATSPLPIGPIPVPPPSPLAQSPLAPQPPPNTPQSRGSIPRVPSPQELVAHTQSIYQQALIKKQLEVQKEKYLAREAARAKSPLPGSPHPNQGQINENLLATTPSKSTPSMVPAAFTPTSVIRKMHETKAEQQQQQQQQQNTNNKDITYNQQQQGTLHTAKLNPQQQLFPPQQQQLQQQLGKSSESPMNRVIMSPQRLPMKSEAAGMNQASPKHQMYQSSPIPVPMHQQQPHSPARIPPSPVRQPRKDSTNVGGGDIDYNKIREVQLQQQQKAAAVDGQGNPGMMSAGSVSMQTRPMGQPSLPVPLLQRMPTQTGQGPPGPPTSPGIYPGLLRGMYPNLNVRNMSPMQLPQQGSGPRGMQQVGSVPMMLNSRAPFPVTSTSAQIPANAAAAAAALAAMHAQVGIQRNLSQQTQNVPRPELPNTPPLASTAGNYNQTFNMTSMTQRSQSPVNLAKWFGTDVLQQPLPQMPPMMRHGPNVLSVEDIECHQ